MTPNYHNANGADGPRVVKWLLGAGLVWQNQYGHFQNCANGTNCDSVARRIYQWRIGGVAEFYALDRVLNSLGVHPSELPDDVWLEVSRSASGEGPTPRVNQQVGLEPKPCLHCGEDIPFFSCNGYRYDRHRYARRRYCTNECAKDARSVFRRWR